MQLPLVHLTDQIDTEAVMRFLRRENKPPLQIDPPGSDQRMVGPQPDPRIPSLAGERQAGVDQPTPQTVAPPLWEHQQDPQLGQWAA